MRAEFYSLLTIRLSTEQKRELEARARAEGSSVSALVRRAVAAPQAAA